MKSAHITRRQFNLSATALLFGGFGASTKAETSVSAKELGFYVPEESAPQKRTFMQWPVSIQVHPDREFLSELQQTIADIANTVVEFQPVVMLMRRKYALTARRFLSHKVEIWDVPTEDLWARDSGPLFVVNNEGQQAINHLNFNGWGNKQVHKSDGKIAAHIAELLGLPLLDSGLVGEAGGVESDGDGTLIANESCWVNDNRNTLPRQEIERRLLNAYGASKMIWTPGVIGQDITDDHIDATARFVAPGRVLIQLPESKDAYPPFSQSAFKAYKILRDATDARGRSFEITTVPDPVNTRITSRDFLASYANYYVGNGFVLCAEFGDKEIDEQAIETLAKLYPDREVISLNADRLGEVGGGIHCATQQQPA